MGYGNQTDGLGLRTLGQANKRRAWTYDPKNGISGWSLPEWMCALAGEVGEAANIIKKIRRGDFTLDEARGDLAKELADIQVYLSLTAEAAGIDLSRATVEKFNEVSKRVGSPVYIGSDNEWHLDPSTPTPGDSEAEGGE